MRFYVYLSYEEAIYASVYGIKPKMPESEVNKLLQKWIEEHPMKVNVGGGKTVSLTTRAVYGGIVNSAINVATKMSLYPQGVLTFVHLKPKRIYPAIAAQYRYRTKIHELLILREQAEAFKRGRFKSAEDAINFYVAMYWKSIVPYSQIRKWIEERAIQISKGVTVTYAYRRVAETLEVLMYRDFSPFYLYVKTEGKKYIPFMEWLYKHRGLFWSKMKAAKTDKEKLYAKAVYNTFMDKYVEFQEWYEKEMAKSPPGGIIYVR